MTLVEKKKELAKVVMAFDVKDMDKHLIEIKKKFNGLENECIYIKAQELIDKEEVERLPLPLKNYEYLE